MPTHSDLVCRSHQTTARSSDTTPPMSNGRPVAARDVVLVELPQPRPMLAALVGMAVEVEKHRFWRGAPDVLQFDPVEAGVDIEVLVHPFEDALAVGGRSADQPLGVQFRRRHYRLANGGDRERLCIMALPGGARLIPRFRPIYHFIRASHCHDECLRLSLPGLRRDHRGGPADLALPPAAAI